MRIIFMGTPAFAEIILKALIADQHEIVVVYTQPPQPAHRGKKLAYSAVYRLAESSGIEIRTPKSLRHNEEELAYFQGCAADIAIVAAYGMILPAPFLPVPRLGCLNVHASLLPRWRGAAPIHAAINAGDEETGITLMQMDEGLDTGAIRAQKKRAISADETFLSLHDKLAHDGALLLTQSLRSLPSNHPQPTQGATYAERLSRDRGRIEWSQPASQIERQVRAFHPWPGAFTSFNGSLIKVGRVELVANRAPIAAGTLLDDALVVKCGDDALRILALQRPGKAMLDAKAFLCGQPMPQGTRFD